MTATDLQNQIRVALSVQGHAAFRANVGKFRMADGRWFDTGLPKGFSDLFGIRAGDGRAFFLEVKVGRDKLSQEQADFLHAMRQRGAIAAEVRSVQDALQALAWE